MGLLKSTSSVLLDQQPPNGLREQVVTSIESESTKVVDLHIWSIGAGMFAAEIVILTSQPQTPVAYKQLLPRDAGLAHVVVEIHSHSEDEH